MRALIASLDEGLLALGDRGEIVVANPAASVRSWAAQPAPSRLRLDELPEPVRDAVALPGRRRADERR